MTYPDFIAQYIIARYQGDNIESLENFIQAAERIAEHLLAEGYLSHPEPRLAP